MKISVEAKKMNDGGFLYQTKVFGQQICLSKALVAREKDAGRLKQEMETGEDWLLTAKAKERNGKTYTNFYFTIAKPKAEAPAGDGALPF